MPRVDLYPEQYDEIVNQKGMVCEWEQAIVCQCYSADSGQPDFSCPICHGSGFRYLPPQQIRVVVTSLHISDKRLETLGLREPGTAYATPPISVIMGYRDRLRFIDFECKYSETLRFNAGDVYSSVTYRNIKSVAFLVKDDEAYEEGVDFEITPDRHHVCWINLEHPIDEDTTMSILYMTTPSYLVVDLLHELRATRIERKVPAETFKELPKQYQLRREDFIYGVNTAKPLPEPEYMPETGEPTDEENPQGGGADEYDY